MEAPTKLSNGAESTLGAYRRLAVVIYGDHSPQVRFIDKKIYDAPTGEQEPVLAAENQMMALLEGMYER